MLPVPTPDPSPPTCPAQATWADRWIPGLQRQAWLPFVLPLAVFLFAGWLGADRPSKPATAAGDVELARGTQEVIPPSQTTPQPTGYPLAYTFQLAATTCAILLVWPVYCRVPWRLSWSAGMVGIVGAVGWIVICRWGLERQFWGAIGWTQWSDYTARPAFNPLAAYENDPGGLTLFLTLRFVGLVALVPLIEEFFLRGFLMRFFLQSDWWTIPLGKVTWTSAAVATIYGVLSHPAEMLAAAAWFSLITWLYFRTRSLWDCVVAHAVTNGLLGVYVIVWQDWTLW